MISLYLTQRVIDSDSLPNTYAGEDVSDQGAADILNFDTPTSSSISPSSDNDNIASSDDSDERGNDIVNDTNDVGYATNESQENTGGPRRSSRTRYPLANFVTYSKFSTAHAQFLAAVTMGNDPTRFSQAITDPNWRDAMHKEIDALKKNGTCVLEDLLHAVAVIRNWELHQMDVHNAFLHGDLDEEVYMKLPPGFYGSCGKVCRLKKSLYGLRQAPRNWFSKLATPLKTFGFTQSYTDYSLFSFKRSGIDLHVLVYVDDLIVAGNNSYVITKFKASMSACIHMKDLGALKYFIVIEIARHPEGLFLSQRKYALDILSESGLLGAKLSHPVKAETRGVTR
ncbi:retrovirus-related pol polyprotein from transposon RE2 [Tanacetum coccineum]